MTVVAPDARPRGAVSLLRSSLGGRVLPRWLPGLLGLLAVLIVWTVVADTVLPESKGLPTPARVISQAYSDGWSFYWPLVKGTAGRALPGYLIGNGIAIALALLVMVVPVIERVVLQVAVASYCLPVLAVGPILTITLSGDHPMMALAALFVLFTTLVGALLGLRSADPTSLDVIRAYGGGTVQQLRRVRIRAALPSTLAALKIAAPTAVLGAILGEYLGGNSNVGLGYALIASEQQLAVPRTWGCALAAAALGGVGYLAVSLVSYVMLPWARATTGTGS